MNLLLDNHQLWVMLIGGLTPLITYLINKVAPWTTETVKGAIQVIMAAVTGALYTALDTNVFGWNSTTAQLVISAIVAALMAHNWLYKPAKINTKLGATELIPARE